MDRGDLMIWLHLTLLCSLFQTFTPASVTSQHPTRLLGRESFLSLWALIQLLPPQKMTSLRGTRFPCPSVTVVPRVAQSARGYSTLEGNTMTLTFIRHKDENKKQTEIKNSDCPQEANSLAEDTNI